MFRQTMHRGMLALALSMATGYGTVSAYTYTVPDDVQDGWEIGSIADEQLDAIAIQEMFERIERGEYPHIRSVLVARHGKLVVEEYFPRPGDLRERAFRRVAPQEITSATKSITSLLVGVAIDRGLIQSADERVADLLPEIADSLPAELRDELRLKHLLSMSAGLEWDEWTHPYSDPRNDHIQMLRSASPLEYVFSRPVVAACGEEFAYNSGISIALGEIIRRATGMRVDRFAEQVLFEPLAITDFYWAKYPGELAQTGGGLYLRPRDMLKIGCLVLHDGRWRDKQVVSEAWIRDSTTAHIPAGAIPDAARADGYGYQWWISSAGIADGAVPTYSARGRGGQFILVVPSADLVAVFTSPPDNTLTFQPLDILERHLLPAVSDD